MTVSHPLQMRIALSLHMAHKCPPEFKESEFVMKSKKTNESQLLELLKLVLPKAIEDPRLASKIMEAIEHELARKNRAMAFEKFCEKCELPNLEAETVMDVKKQFEASFPEGDVTIKPDKKEQTLAVEVDLPDGSQFQTEMKVKPLGAEGDAEQEVVLKFVPFPVALPGDKELVWFMAKRENMTPDEASIMLEKVEGDFWGSKSGQKLIRDRVERSFPEFIGRVPAGMLNEVGLKRHYKEPEPVKVLHPQAPK
jgi:hypothetical protein